MRYSYQNSFRLYKQAVRTYYRSSPTRRFWFHFRMWGMLTLGVALLIFTAMTGGLESYSPVRLPLAMGLIAGGTVALLMRPWQLRRCYKAWCGEAKNRAVFVEIDGAELKEGVEGLSETRFRRDAICATAEDDSILLLFLNEKKFLYFPKSVVPQAAINEIRLWLEQRGASSQC